MRIKAWLFTGISLLGAVLLNTVIVATTGFDPSTFTMLFLVPVGTLVLGSVVASGFYVAARRHAFRPTLVDLFFLSGMCLSLLLLVGVAEYLVLASHSNMESLGAFLRKSVTETQYSMYMRGMPKDAAPVKAGDAGWLLLMIRASALLAIAKIAHMSLADESSRWK